MSRRRAMVAYELTTQLKSASFAALVLLLIAATSTLNPVAMIRGGSESDLPVRAIANSVYALSPTFAMSGFFVYPFFVSLMSGLSVLRDDEAGMSELLRSSPLTSAEYYWTKFAGVMTALCVAMALHVLIVIAFRETGVGGVARGPFDLPAYLIAAGLFVVPGVLWTAGLTFVIGARSKAPMAVYAVPVALFMSELVLLWNWHPRDIASSLDALLMILDPTGLRWLSHSLFATDRGIIWYNTAPLRIDIVLTLGRVVTVLTPLAAVAMLARQNARTTFASPQDSALSRAIRSIRRRFTARDGAVRSPAHVRQAAGGAASSRARSFGNLHDLPMRRRTPSIARATASILMSELRTLWRQPSGYLFAALLFAVVAEVGGAEPDVYGSTAVLTAGGVAINALPAVTVLTCLFLLFVIVEMLHRDRATGFDAIALSSPIPTTSFVVGKALAALVMIAVITAVCVTSGSILLLAQSGPTVSLWPLLLVFGGVLGPTYILWIAFVTAVMSLVQSRTAALAVGFVALLLTAAQFIRGSMTWITNWPLWGSLRWTEFAVFPLDGEALLLNRLLALALALALFGAARLLFVRTERDPIAARARRTPAVVGRLALRATPFVALPLFTGAFLAVRVHDAYDGPSQVRAAAYEAAHQRQWESVAPAVVQHIDVNIALDPTRRQFAVDGTYDLVNRTSSPITTLPFTVPFSFGRVVWSINGAPIASSVTNGLQVLSLSAPLAPGDTVHVHFRYTARVNDGISRNGGPVDAFVLPSSILVSTHRGDFLPVPGYRRTSAATLRTVSTTGSAPDGVEFFNRGWRFTATMRVRAPQELTINGVGQRLASTTIDDETITTWHTDEPVAALNLVGGAYEVRRADGVAVFHHPKHTHSLDVIVSTLAAARRHFSNWFYPYPWDELRLSEYADLSTQATSYPTNITFSEGLGFLTTAGGDGGLPFAVTAHEAAHQWWGHLLTAGSGPGTGFLVEGMADYATLLLYGVERGISARTAFARLLERQYLDGREASRERALLHTQEESSADEAVLQKKGAWAMWMVHNSLGAERTFAGLRAFIADHREPGRFGTPDELLRALRQQAADTVAFDEHIAQWFRTTHLPEFRLEEARCAPTGREWRCDAALRNIGTGDAIVEVAAYQGDSAMVGGTVRRSIRAGTSVALRWRLPQQPARFVVDPEVKVLQVGRERAATTPVVGSVVDRE